MSELHILFLDLVIIIVTDIFNILFWNFSIFPFLENVFLCKVYVKKCQLAFIDILRLYYNHVPTVRRIFYE